MILNYIKIALRQLKKNTGFTFLNIFGMALGMGSAILILLWMQDEMSYNKHNDKYESLYQVMGNQTYEGVTYTFSSTPGLLSAALKAEVPELANTTRMDWGNHWLFGDGDNTTFEDGSLVDSSFFEMFTVPFIHGNDKAVFRNEHSMVISEKMSHKYFGDLNPVGKYIKVNNEKEFEITGVFKDMPKNSSIKFEWLASFKIFENENPWWTQWGANGMQTFVEVKPGVDMQILQKKLTPFIKNKKDDAIAQPLLLAMKDWRLRSEFKEGKQDGGRIEYIKLFGIIALLLIFIACVNFMNLATSRSEQRMREVGVRKVLGAQRMALMKQFIGESIVLSIIAMVVACVMVVLALPYFNNLVEKTLSLNIANPLQWLILLSIAIVCGTLAGSYPSVFLSSFSPVSVFKGIIGGKTTGAVYVRKGLVVTQFVISTVLIISTIVIFEQIQHVKDRQLGYNKDNLVYMRQRGKMNERFDVIKQDLLATGVVSHVAASSQSLLSEGNNSSGFSWKGCDATKPVLITIENGSSDFINTSGMSLTDGHDFSPDGKTDSLNVIINESFALLMNFKKPIGELLYYDSIGYTIIGVVKDFIYNDFYKAPAPYVLFCDKANTGNIFVRFNKDANTATALAQVEAVLKKDNPGYPFEHKFLDDEFDKLFKSEMLVAKLSWLFALLTIVVSSLGLFGLAAYTAERRTKEIGIRRVLGATIANVFSLLSKDFLKLVFVSIVVAAPIAWYIMNKWLQEYAYRINMQWWMFLFAGLLAIFITIITVSFQSIKSALANPIKSLRTE